MLLLPMGRSSARRPYLLLLLVLGIALIAQVAVAQDSTENTSQDTPSDTNDTADDNNNNDNTSDDTSDDTTSTTTNNYPIITPPPTDGAPYMQESTAPEGTVFIAVGAVLGAMGLSILAWRGLVAWSVNRSVRRAAMMHSSENKALLRDKKKKRSGRSRSRGHGHGHSHIHPNAVSLEKINGTRLSTYSTQHSSKIPTSGSGLFFSPTAGMHNSGNRGSSYLPAGYYAAGNAAAGLAQNVGLSPDHLPPQARGYTRTGSGPSPPATPMSPPPHGMHDAQRHSSSNLRQSYAAASTSSLNLTSPPQGRTPSAYLEDLFENHPPQSQNRHH